MDRFCSDLIHTSPDVSFWDLQTGFQSYQDRYKNDEMAEFLACFDKIDHTQFIVILYIKLYYNFKKKLESRVTH
jgi:hypothetical protein